MQIGVNWIAPQTLPVILQLIEHGYADFCEINVDSAIHLPPKHIRAALRDAPVSLHIVASRFLEKSEHEITSLAKHMRPWIAEMQPIYVSDHLVQFTQQQKPLPFILDLEYVDQYDHIKERVMLWQALLDTQILFENHASITSLGVHQARFFQRLSRDTGIEMLFDFSNAYIAEHNQICPMHEWDALIRTAMHFHVAGFRIDKTTQLAIDSHDAPIATEVLTRMQHYHLQHKKSIVIEIDSNIDFEFWKNEISRIRQVVAV